MSRLINLLPWRAQRIKRRALLWTALFSVGLAGIALGSGAWRWYIHQHIVQVRAMPPSEQQLQAQRDHTVRLRKRLETLTALHQQRLSTLRHQQCLRDWAQRLAQLAAQLPDAVWLSALRFDADQLEITGKSLTMQASGEWAGVIKTLPGIRDVQQGATERDTDAAWRFRWVLAVEHDDAQTR
ncbi:PilN domain-containing protein [Atlantibacter hermannii]|uniref:PilN domain-containing protein n=1 Tax=Atlantibacter hermannii TaxID=565 RepID=UPI0013EF172C|nr:PilN domain-containing protein [Atlantibacter hermannii]